MTTAWDLAGDAELLWDAEGFTVGTGSIVWEDARATRTYDRVRIARLVPQDDGTIRQIDRYVDPDQPVTIVRALPRGEEA